jgi:hypothetical protein
MHPQGTLLREADRVLALSEYSARASWAVKRPRNGPPGEGASTARHGALEEDTADSSDHKGKGSDASASPDPNDDWSGVSASPNPKGKRSGTSAVGRGPLGTPQNDGPRRGTYLWRKGR